MSTCAAYKSSSDAFVDANVQLAIASARLVGSKVAAHAHAAPQVQSAYAVTSSVWGGGQLAEQSGKRVHIVVPDEGEYNRSFRMCGPAPLLLLVGAALAQVVPAHARFLAGCCPQRTPGLRCRGTASGDSPSATSTWLLSKGGLSVTVL